MAARAYLAMRDRTPATAKATAVNDATKSPGLNPSAQKAPIRAPKIPKSSQSSGAPYFPPPPVAPIETAPQPQPDPPMPPQPMMAPPPPPPQVGCMAGDPNCIGSDGAGIPGANQ